MIDPVFSSPRFSRYAELGDPTPFMETVGRGIDEARDLLRASGVL